MDYTRVIPRDFFNEAKLLKCMGQLALKVLDRAAPQTLEIIDNGEPFHICLMECGHLTVRNVLVLINDTPHVFKTTYNSKRNFPFLVDTEDEGEIEVFDEQGDFTTEFLEYCLVCQN
jgi:hypothetical protein